MIEFKQLMNWLKNQQAEKHKSARSKMAEKQAFVPFDQKFNQKLIKKELF